ncbi:MAG: Hpt domain-containing protein [Chloroflexota bacterium]|jgi:HPt (histidine-containing phosphotransfer) domain-containing protein
MTEAIIDKSTFDGLTELVGDDFIGELVETFFEEAPGLLDEMGRALEDGDAEAFRRSAHSLKSNGQSFGATRLAALARELEYLGRDDRLDEAGPKLLQLQASYEETAEALRVLI